MWKRKALKILEVLRVLRFLAGQSVTKYDFSVLLWTLILGLIENSIWICIWFLFNFGKIEKHNQQQCWGEAEVEVLFYISLFLLLLVWAAVGWLAKFSGIFVAISLTLFSLNFYNLSMCTHFLHRQQQQQHYQQQQERKSITSASCSAAAYANFSFCLQPF